MNTNDSADDRRYLDWIKSDIAEIKGVLHDIDRKFDMQRGKCDIRFRNVEQDITIARTKIHVAAAIIAATVSALMVFLKGIIDGL